MLDEQEEQEEQKKKKLRKNLLTTRFVFNERVDVEEFYFNLSEMNREKRMIKQRLPDSEDQHS